MTEQIGVGTPEPTPPPRKKFKGMKDLGGDLFAGTVMYGGLVLLFSGIIWAIVQIWRAIL